MKLKHRLPPNQTLDQVKNHYLAEKAIALRLKKSTREERKSLYPRIYADLFQKVADHPRLRQRGNEKERKSANKKTFELVKDFVNGSTVFVEFGPGDCRFASFTAGHVSFVQAVDVYDQRGASFEAPDNFELILYNGYNLELEEESVDVVFSDQFLEHLHPDDADLHFSLVKRILRQDGVSILRTPHAFFGPHDISKYFSAEPEGLHLKEWTFSEIFEHLKRLNFSSCYGYWRIFKGINKKYILTPPGYFKFAERLLERLPKKPNRLLSKLFLPRQIVIIARK